MESCRAAERALVAALALGQADPADLSGRIRASDFTDPAAALLFDVAMDAPAQGRESLGRDLPRLLRVRGALRGDGYPLREMLDWLPKVPVPAHPEPWAALVVAGSVGRVVGQCGMRLMQASETALVSEAYGAGRVLAVAAAQRAAVHAAARRWKDLPASWREGVPQPRGDASVGDRQESGISAVGAREWSAAPAVERDLLTAVVAAPVLVERLSWLRAEDFTDPRCGQLYATLAALHRTDRPVDLITLTAALETAPDDPVGRPARAGADVGGGWAGIDPRLGQPALAGFLARQVMTLSVLRDVHDAGARLREVAAAPATAGGAGLALLGQALGRLDAVAEHGRRWQQAHVRPSSAVAGPGLKAARPSLALVRPGSVAALTEPSVSTVRIAGSDRTAG